MNCSIKTFIILNKDNIESEEDIFLVKANCIDDAINKYAKEYYINLEYLKATMEDRSMNTTFWEPFFLPTFNLKDGLILVDSDGKIAADLSDDEVIIKFKENVENYCGEYKDFARILIEFYFDRTKLFEELPIELREYIALKEIDENRDNIIIKEV